MGFGLRAVNDNSYVQIDSDSPRLCLLGKGTYGASSYTATVTFPVSIKTQEPPMVFIRPATANSNEPYRTMILTGSAGNWTGFQISASNLNYRPAGDWFVAAFASRGDATFGMRLFGPDGSLAYDTGAYAVLVSTVLSTWTYVGRVQLTIGAYYKWVCGRALAAGEYFMINVFSLGIQDNNSGSTCAVSMDYTNNQTCMWANGFTAWVDQGHRPVLFAKLVV